MKSYAPYHIELCSLASRALLSVIQSIALSRLEHCFWRSEAMLLAFKSIALGVRKHSSQSPKALIPVFEKKFLLILTSHTPILLLTTSVSSTCNFYNIPSHLPSTSHLGGVPNQSTKNLILLVLYVMKNGRLT